MPLEQERKPLLNRRDGELEIEQTQERLSDLQGIEIDLERAVSNLGVIKKEDDMAYESSFPSLFTHYYEYWGAKGK